MDFHNIVLEQIETIERNHEALPSHRKHLKAVELIKQAITLKWGDEIWNKYEPIIDSSINFIIFLSKNKKALANINKRWCSCF